MWKPTGITSFDVIRVFKRAVHPDFKVGHGGTLDPFADGVLLLLLGKATKRMNSLMELPKTYDATAVLGARSDTLDRTGKIINTPTNQQTNVTIGQIKEAAAKFAGEMEQAIPEYSAAKVNGVPRYKLARAGKEQIPKSKLVTIYDLKIINSNYSNNRSIVEFEATVSSGTYIRQLSYDILASLGVESYLESLTRTRIGEIMEVQCCQITEFATEGWKGKLRPLILPAHGE